MRPFICAILAAMLPVMTSAQSVPPAIFTDPPADATHPAKMTVLHMRGQTIGSRLKAQSSLGSPGDISDPAGVLVDAG